MNRISFSGFSFQRLKAVFFKEFVQMMRDRITFIMMVSVPVTMLLIFGYAIDTDPRHMPTVVEVRDDGVFARSFLAGLKNSSYFKIIAETHSDAESEAMIRSGKAVFLIEIPEGFERRLVRGERPEILIAADATDPVASGGATGAMEQIARSAFARDLQALPRLAPELPPFDVVVHRRYNPAGITAYNIVPGVLGLILTMTLVMITAIALTREAERGTLEMLLATPVRPAEVMIGKTAPYVVVGAIQVILALLLGLILFHIPFQGSLLLFAGAVSIFIFTNLMLGFLFSTIARSQMQAMQMTFFVFLPQVILSGFMFPYRAMPDWAQAMAEVLPLTHFMRFARGIMLKDAGAMDIWADVWPLLLILSVFSSVALLRYRRTMD